MKYIFLIFIAFLVYLLIQSRFESKYQEGYKAGMKSALKINPPSEELDSVCMGLWIGEQNKKYWEKEKGKK